MELVDMKGKNFKEVSLDPNFEEEDLRFIVYQILKGLDHTHSKGVFHRDIKSNNIMLDLETL